MTTTLTALDLFAGTGWGVACQALGIEEHGIDNAPAVLATRAANGMTNAGTDVWHALEDGHEVPDHDLLIASPPCQTFSQAGSGKGRAALNDVLRLVTEEAWKRPEDMRAFAAEHGDDRTALVLAPMAYVWKYSPTYVVLEQVPPVLPVWEACADALRDLGYSVWTGNLQAEQYGVPQTRRRAVLIARLDGVEAAPPTPTHSRYHSRTPERLDDGVLPWVSMAEALDWNSDADAAMRSNYGTGGDPRNRGERTGHQPAPTVTSKVDRNKWVPTFNDQSGTAFDPEWPAKRPATVIAGRPLVQNPGATANRFNGSTKSRNDGVVVTLEEAAILQSYPADFTWVGDTKSALMLQVGNAVPPLLAQAVLATLLPDGA